MTIIRITFLFGLAVLLNQSAFSQMGSNESFKKSKRMTNSNLKETIHFLYDSVLNARQFEKLSIVVSPDYQNHLGEKGVAAFQKTILALATAFTNSKWKIEEIICEKNKVVVKQKFTGTQSATFQNIPPTNKTVSVDGIAIYEFKDGKMIRSQIQTDRLGFMQQLEMIPKNLEATNDTTVYFVDKFFVPKASIVEFLGQMKYIRSFVANLSGYIRGEAFERVDNEGNLIIMTVAVWKNEEMMNEAKQAVQREFQRIGLNPGEAYQRLNIKPEREVYSGLKNY